MPMSETAELEAAHMLALEENAKLRAEIERLRYPRCASPASRWVLCSEEFVAEMQKGMVRASARSDHRRRQR